jgi:molybdenum cofactor cytidylyltransferase
VIRCLVTAFRATGRPIAVPVYRDGPGNPVLFAAGLFGELRAVTGDRGGRGVIARDPDRVTEVPVDTPMPADIDTPRDYEASRRPRGDGPLAPWGPLIQ